MDTSENISIVVSFPRRTTCFNSVELALKKVVFIGLATPSQPIMFDEITVLCSAERRELPWSEDSTHTPFLRQDHSWRGSFSQMALSVTIAKYKQD